MTTRVILFALASAALAGAAVTPGSGSQVPSSPKAFIDGTEPGWRTLGPKDFAPVNGERDTWVWKGDVLFGTGTPIGVLRTSQQLTNFELVIQWRHLRSGGNSGVFLWVPAVRVAGSQT